MMRHVLKITTIVLLAVGLGLVMAPVGAQTVPNTILDKGFWWQGNAGIGVASAPPDVEEGELLVEAAPTGATSVAAVRGQLAPDTGNPTLTLRIASQQGASSALVLACQAGSAWNGEHSGEFSSAPSAACEVGSVQGILAEDGSSMAFPLGPLQFSDQVNVVLVAGSTGEGTSPFRIVFEEPTGTDLTSVPEAPAPSAPARPDAGRDTGFSGGGGGFTSPTTQAPAPSSGGGSTFTPPAPTASPAPSAAPAVQPVTPAVPEEMQGETATAPFATQQNLPEIVEVAERNIGQLRLLGFVVLVLGTITGLFWWRAENAVPLRAVFAGVDSATLATLNAQVGDDTVEGGLGRFRRSRAGEAPRLF